jgi:general nucleoside transport system ATP-binding protein
VIFIAHKLPEVLEISDTITVMRQGKTVGQVKTKEVTEQSLAAMMVGREVSLRVDRKPTDQTEKVAAVTGLRVVNARGTEVVAGLDLNVHAGEIVGLVGVEGNGQAETLEAIAGLRPIADGHIEITSKNATQLSVLERRGLGLASIPEDRIAEGLATGASVARTSSRPASTTSAMSATACSTSRRSRPMPSN